MRVSLERPDSITASAVSAREEIGRAVAQKIREVEDARARWRQAEQAQRRRSMRPAELLRTSSNEST